MKFTEFKSLYDRLNTHKDVKNLSKQTGLDEELLNVIYTQRTVREATKRYHVVKRNAHRMLKEWRAGCSLLQIAEKWEFPPILTGLILFQEDGYSKKEFWKYVREPECISNPRTKKEIIEITEADTIYSPWGNDVQHKRGAWGETKLQDWLTSHNVTYRTEKDLRGKFTKTPDCLLDAPLKVNGWTVNWIESKASFGDRIEFNKNIRGQLSQYVEMFGPGLVVYWFGHVDEVDCPPGIEIIDACLCDMSCERAPNADFCPEEIVDDNA
jgi:hypothetical protein